jgi:aspartate 1-decarboxylase
MMLTLLKSKLHHARITQCDLHYEGSIGIPRDLMEAAGLLPSEQVDVLNMNNGERFTTYIIPLESGSSSITVNGPAARKAQVGDSVIVCAYAIMTAEEAKTHAPRVVLLTPNNTIQRDSV